MENLSGLTPQSFNTPAELASPGHPTAKFQLEATNSIDRASGSTTTDAEPQLGTLGLAENFLRSMGHSAIQNPLSAAAQVLDAFSGPNSHYLSQVQFSCLQAPNQAEFGTADYWVQQAGGAVGALLPFWLAGKGVRAFTRSGLAEAELGNVLSQRKVLGLTLKESFLTGFVNDALLHPSDPNDTRSLLTARSLNGLSGGIAMWALSACSIPFHPSPSSELTRSRLVPLIKNNITGGILSGIPVGFVSAHTNEYFRNLKFDSTQDFIRSATTEAKFANKEAVTQSILTSVAIGGGFGTYHHFTGQHESARTNFNWEVNSRPDNPVDAALREFKVVGGQRALTEALAKLGDNRAAMLTVHENLGLNTGILRHLGTHNFGPAQTLLMQHGAAGKPLDLNLTREADLVASCNLPPSLRNKSVLTWSISTDDNPVYLRSGKDRLSFSTTEPTVRPGLPSPLRLEELPAASRLKPIPLPADFPQILRTGVAELQPWQQRAVKYSWEQATNQTPPSGSTSTWDRYLTTFDSLYELGEEGFYKQTRDLKTYINDGYKTTLGDVQQKLLYELLSDKNKDDAFKLLQDFKPRAFADAFSQMYQGKPLETLTEQEITKLAKGWEVAYALKLSRVFGNTGTKWLQQRAKINESAHDATYWLPDESNKELSDWLQKHSKTPRNKLEIAAKEWQNLTDEQKQLPLDKLLLSITAPNYTNVHYPDFALEAAKWKISPERFGELQDTFMLSQYVPSTFPETVWESGNLRAYFMRRSDPRLMFSGHYVGNCLSPENHGEKNALFAQESINGGIFVVEDKTKKQEDNVIAASLAIRDNTGGLVFYSVESNKGLTTLDGRKVVRFTDKEPPVRKIYEKASQDLVQRFRIVTMGDSCTRIDLSHYQKAGSWGVKLPDDYSSEYRNIDGQVILAENPALPPESPDVRALMKYNALIEPSKVAHDAATESAQDAYLAAKKVCQDAYHAAIQPAIDAHDAALEPYRLAYLAAKQACRDKYLNDLTLHENVYLAAVKPVQAAFAAAAKSVRDAFDAVTRPDKDAFDAAIKAALDARAAAMEPARHAYLQALKAGLDLYNQLIGGKNQPRRSTTNELLSEQAD